MCLLHIKAEDKCYINHDSDSILDIICGLQRYFERHGTAHDRIDAAYYMGGAYRDRGEIPLAIKWYKKVIGSAANIPLTFSDSCTLAFAYAQLAGMNDVIEDSVDEYKNMKTSFEIQKRLKIANFRTYKDMAQAARDMNKMDEAEKLYQSCFQMLLSNKLENRHIGLLGELLSFYVAQGKAQLADFTKELLMSLPAHTLQSNAYAALASYYRVIRTNNDSALFYTLRAAELENRWQAKANLTKRAACLYEEQGDKDLAIKYMHKYLFLCDSVKTISRKEANMTSVLLVLHKDLDEAKKECEVYQEKTTIYGYFILGLAILLVIVGSMSNLILRKHRRSENELCFRIQEKEEINKNLKSRNLELQESLKKWELHKSANEELHNLQEFLRKKEFTPNCSLYREEWLHVFTVVDMLCPSFRNDILKLNPNMEEGSLIFLYLMKLGKSRAGIARILDKSPSNVGRTISKVESELGKTIEEVIGHVLITTTGSLS